MGGNFAALLEDIQQNKRNIQIDHASFISHYQNFISLAEQLESKLKELEAREAKVEQLEEEKEKLKIREKRCEEKEIEVAAKAERWIETEKRMQLNATKLPTVIHFNVGGTKFSATKDKLLQHKGSLFEQILTSDHTQQLPSGEIFIERDPTFFPFIVRFVLDGTLQPPQNLSECALIEKEFEFFQIPFRFPPRGRSLSQSAEMQHQYSTTTSSSSTQSALRSSAPAAPMLKNELVLCGDNSFGETINEWLPNKHFKILYKASVNGFGKAEFHRLCDHKGATLVVIRSANNFLFGGYTPIPWDCGGISKTDVDMFIFTLSNPHNIPPTKFSINSKSRTGIQCRAEYGPVFGGGDIRVANNANLNSNSNFDFPFSYIDTTGKGNVIFTGAATFTAKEIEVYHIL